MRFGQPFFVLKRSKQPLAKGFEGDGVGLEHCYAHFPDGGLLALLSRIIDTPGCSSDQSQLITPVKYQLMAVILGGKMSYTDLKGNWNFS